MAAHCLTKRHAFQHTAARRRLHATAVLFNIAGCFNTQPPEGGCGGDLERAG